LGIIGFWYYYNKPNCLHPAITWHRLNLLETKEIPALLNKVAPDLIIHAAAIANANFCEEHPALSHHVNVYASIALAEAAAKLDLPILFISTDLVFNGHSGPYAEDDFPYPLSVYGGQKLAVEESFLNDFEKTMVARLPLLFGWGPSYTQPFLKDWVEKLQAGEIVNAFEDEYRTAISAEDAVKGLEKLVTYLLDNAIDWSAKKRLFHLGGNDRLSRYELGLLIAKYLSLDETLLLPSLQQESTLKAPRPKDVSLTSELARTWLSFKPSSTIEQLQKLNQTK